MIVLRGGTVLTQDPARPVADAIAHAGGRIVAVGSEPEVRAATGACAQVHEIGGRYVLPGFVDAHHHLSSAVIYAGTLDCGAPPSRGIADVLALVRREALFTAPDAWLVGDRLNERALRERRLPTARELDTVCPDRPLLLMHHLFHACVVNSFALALLGIGRTTPDPPAGRIGRRPDGQPNGLLVETAMSAAERRAQQSLLAHDRAFVSRLQMHQNRLFSVGITRVADPAVPPDLEALYAQLRASGHLRVGVVMLPVGDRGFLLPPADRLRGPPTGHGPEDLQVGPLKLFADGADELALRFALPRVALGLLAALSDIPTRRGFASLRMLLRFRARLDAQLHVNSGVRFLTNPSIGTLARDAVDAGFTLAVHALGNAAVRDAVQLLGSVRMWHRDVPPPRIEHALLVDGPDLPPIADLGVQLVCQPGFLRFAQGARSTVPGLHVLPLRRALDLGIRVAGSSDYPVVDPDPIEGIRVAVTREYEKGCVLDEDQAVTAEEAITMYTSDAALACGCLGVCGTLEPGKRADLVVLSSDPRRIGSGASRPCVLETVVGGETVYRRLHDLTRGGSCETVARPRPVWTVGGSSALP
ncbi:MAG: amidohydrolase [Polyangiaceae bacterium]|nr:amidohydrolase [Polyangiaceae bacterium]